MAKNHERYELIEFDFIYEEKDGANYLVLLDDIKDFYLVDEKIIRKGTAYIRYPSWYEMHEISRLSAKRNPYTGKKTQSIDEIKKNKLKVLIWKLIDDEGEVNEPIRVPVFLFNRVRKLMSGVPVTVISDGNIVINTFLHRMISYLEYAREENDSIEKTASELMKLNDGEDSCIWMGTTNYRWELAPGESKSAAVE